MGETFTAIANNILEIVKNLTLLGSAVALFYFILGIVKYMTHGDDASQRTQSGMTIAYGLIALFVLIAVWGLVGLIQTSILPESGGIGIPQFQGGGGR